jgi:hypothetical protein
MTAEDWELLQQLSYQPTGFVASSSGGCSLEGESAAQVRAAGDLGGRPLIVLASATPTGSADFDGYWIQTVQPELAKLSSRGRLRLVPESTGFGTQNDAPNVVVEAIREVVTEVETKTPVL